MYLSSLYCAGLSPSGFLSFEAERHETQICCPIEELIIEMKEWEATRDKWTEQLTRWKRWTLSHWMNCLLDQTKLLETPRIIRRQLPVPSAFDPMHSCTLVCRGTLTGTEVFCDKGYTRDIHLMLLLPVTQLLSINILKLSVKLNLNSKPNCFKSASMVTIYLEFELMEWQGHTIRCSAFVNNKYQWSQDEGWGDWAAKEGKQWFSVK